MPFDGVHLTGNCRAAIEILEEVSCLLGTPGKWTRINWHDGRGGYCLMGAVQAMGGKDRHARRRVRRYLNLALRREGLLRIGAEVFNDECETVTPVLALLASAKEIARADLCRGERPTRPGYPIVGAAIVR